MAKDKDEKKTRSFSSYTLFSEPIQFNTAEIEAALLQDFPELDIDTSSAVHLATDCDTAEFITAPLFFGARGADACGVTTLVRLPGFGTWDPKQITTRQRIGCPDIAERLARNASYICVSVSAKSESVVDRFRAARLCSCITALFADLPVALATYWESADHFLSPVRVDDMAHGAISEEWPVDKWIGLMLDARGMDDAKRSWAAGTTLGLAPFLDFEVSIPAAPLSPAEVGTTLLTTAQMTAAFGHTLKDGDTIGLEGADRNKAFRIRWLPKGAHAPSLGDVPAPHDTFILIHPESPFDEVAYFGTPQPKAPNATTQVVHQRSRMDFFKKYMRQGTAR